MPSQILVTGGAGFLGSHLCEALLDEGHEVFCLDNFSSGVRENIEELTESPSFHVINQDVRLPSSLPSVDQIYHLASRASPSDFTEHPVEIALANTQGTRRLLDHARGCDARMVFASTSEIYGDPEIHPQPESYSGNVNIRGPRGCYDESKRFGETLTVTYAERYNVDVRTARIFNTYGPRMRPDDGRVVPTFVKQALSDEDLTVYGDGTQTRSFSFVTDTVEGLRALMNTPDLKNEVVNIGNNNEVSISQLAEMITALCTTDSGVTYEDLPEDDPQQRCPDLTKARRLLDWEPDISLEDGLQQTIDHFERTWLTTPN